MNDKDRLTQCADSALPERSHSIRKKETTDRLRSSTVRRWPNSERTRTGPSLCVRVCVIHTRPETGRDLGLIASAYLATKIGTVQSRR